MGGPMARHLVMGGHTVAVWSHNQKKAKELADSAGALFCATPAEVAQNSECAFLCVGDTAMSREVILGEKGLVKGAKKGFVIADCSTVSPLESSRIAQELESTGYRISRCSLYRLESRRGRGNTHLHDRRQEGSL